MINASVVKGHGISRRSEKDDPLSHPERPRTNGWSAPCATASCGGWWRPAYRIGIARLTMIIGRKARPLALGVASCYFVGMVRNRIRRLCAVFLALTLAVGVSMHGAHASDMGVTMAAAAASDMPMPGECDCGGNDKMSVASCSSQCTGIPAIQTPSLALDIVLIGGYADVAAPSATGHTRPPDPYPPRPAVLS
jgi:hypothetical protein